MDGKLYLRTFNTLFVIINVNGHVVFIIKELKAVALIAVTGHQPPTHMHGLLLFYTCT